MASCKNHHRFFPFHQELENFSPAFEYGLALQLRPLSWQKRPTMNSEARAQEGFHSSAYFLRICKLPLNKHSLASLGAMMGGGRGLQKFYPQMTSI
jgi:hypothetical protein